MGKECFIITLFSLLYARGGILLTYGKNLHDHIIGLRVEVWSHITNVAPLRFSEVP